MSQSDYIKYKKTQQVLNEQTKFPKVIGTSDYTNFEKYTIETTVPNIKLRYSRLIAPSTISVLDMDKNFINNSTHTYPTFILCRNTNTRPNRVLNTVSKPSPTLRLNKVYNPSLCTFHPTEYTTRVCPCNKHICKCATIICED
jgi:hypothetical protein